jgi:hypothetical protein
MTDTTKSIIDYAYNDDAKSMRDALYSDIQDRVMAHIDAKKQEIARTLISNPEVSEEPSEEEVENS